MSHPLDQYMKRDGSIDPTIIPGPENTDTLFQPKARDMSLRDSFAEAALQGLIGLGNPSDIAETAYRIADAMLAQRDK